MDPLTDKPDENLYCNQWAVGMIPENIMAYGPVIAVLLIN